MNHLRAVNKKAQRIEKHVAKAGAENESGADHCWV